MIFIAQYRGYPRIYGWRQATFNFRRPPKTAGIWLSISVIFRKLMFVVNFGQNFFVYNLLTGYLYKKTIFQVRNL